LHFVTSLFLQVIESYYSLGSSCLCVGVNEVWYVSIVIH